MPLGTDFWVYTAVVLLSIGNGLMWPSFLSILSQAGSPVIQGTIQGYASSMGSLASIFGLIFGGLLFGAVGPQIFYIAAVMMGLVFLMALRLWSQGRATVGEPESYDEIIIAGNPNINSRIAGGVNGDVATCAIVLNAIPQVLRAQPGLHTMADIPLVSFFG